MIDAFASSVGDTQTAKPPATSRGEEERMSSFIAELLPQLATDVAHDEIPVSEIEGAAKRRTSTASGKTRRAAAKPRRAAAKPRRAAAKPRKSRPKAGSSKRS